LVSVSSQTLPKLRDFRIASSSVLSDWLLLEVAWTNGDSRPDPIASFEQLVDNVRSEVPGASSHL
jgi:hypothetical protein